MPNKHTIKSTGTDRYRDRISEPRMWTLDYELPDGHRVFQLNDSSLGVRWAIADESGETPPETDDGVLFLDIDDDRPLHISVEGDRSVYSIPLLALDGSLTRTPSNAASIFVLSHKYQWPVKVQWSGFAMGERLYQVKAIMP